MICNTTSFSLGDLGPILPDFEQAVTHPIQSSLFGELLRLLLIQVQKVLYVHKLRL
jgi:hypothetical protein